MIGFSIMMWFVSFVLFIVAISLLRGNTSAIHGNVFENTVDKVGYGKALGKPVLFMSIGIFICGIVALLRNSNLAIVNAIIVLLVVIVVSAIWFIIIQKHYSCQIKK